MRRRRGGAGGRRRRGTFDRACDRIAGHKLRRIEEQHAHHIERAKIGIGTHLEGAFRAGHRADTKPARQHAVASRGVDLVALIERGAVGKEIEPELGAVVAGGHRPHAGGPDEDGDVAVEVVQQEHTGDGGARIDRAPDEAIAVDDCVADAHAVVPAEIDQRAAEERTARIGDDAAGDEMQRRLVHRIQQSAEMGILALEQLGVPLPLLELLVLGLETVDLVEGIGIRACAESSDGAPSITGMEAASSTGAVRSTKRSRSRRGRYDRYGSRRAYGAEEVERESEKLSPRPPPGAAGAAVDR